MAHYEQQEFCRRMRDIFPEYFKEKNILDIGSLDINGNNRFLFTGCKYIGLDVGHGTNVDVVSVGHLYNAPDKSFDTIISTEVFEHDMFYGETIQNVIRMLKPGGAFIFTCASDGRPEHGTRKSDGSFASPLLIQVSENWSDYYKNLSESDIKSINGFNESFPDGLFQYNPTPGDLYFFGVKGGIPESQRNALNAILTSNKEFTISFDMVPKVESNKLNGKSKLVRFSGIDDNGSERIVYESTITDYMWASPSDISFRQWKVYLDNELKYQTNISFDSVCAIVSSHPDSENIKNKTVNTINNIQENIGVPVICATHIDYKDNPNELKDLAKHYIMNPINTFTKQSYYRYFKGTVDGYKIFVDLWSINNNIYHGPAVHQNYYNGVCLAKNLGYKYAILTNFDMNFSNEEVNKVKSVLNTVLVNESDGFFFYANMPEGPTYRTVFCVVNVDIFLDTFQEIKNESDYLKLRSDLNSESTGLENIYYHAFKNKNGFIIKEILEWDFFKSEECLTDSQFNLYSIVPIKENDNSNTIVNHGIMIFKSNACPNCSIEVIVEDVNSSDLIFREEFEVKQKIEKFIPIQLDNSKSYNLILNDKENSKLIRQSKYKFDDIPSLIDSIHATID